MIQMDMSLQVNVGPLSTRYSSDILTFVPFLFFIYLDYLLEKQYP